MSRIFSVWLALIVTSCLCASIGAAVQANAADAAHQSSENSTGHPRIVQVSGGVMLGMVQQKTMPIYPDQAMIKGIQGDTVFRIDLDETGKILLAWPIEGDPLLVAASVEAFRSFRFRPYLLNGVPVPVETELGYHFSAGKTAAGVTGHVECVTKPPNQLQSFAAVGDKDNVLVISPRKVSGPDPTVSPDLAGQSGSVYVAVTIDVDGKVQDVKVIAGDEPFVAPVVDALKQQVYDPRMIDGKPVAQRTEFSYRFGPQQ